MSNEITVTPEFTTKNNLTTRDILSVVMAKAETKLKADLATAQKNIKSVEADLVKAKADLVEAIRTYVFYRFQPQITAVNDALAQLGFAEEHLGSPAFEFEPAFSFNAPSEKNKDGFILVEFKINNRVRKKEIAVPDRVLQLHEAVESLVDALSRAMDDAVELRKKLSSLPSLERQYNARLVEAQLNKTEAGQALLESLTFDLEDQLKLLA